jgi:lipid-A-disaccharide synthase
MNIFVVAGEASADLLGAGLLQALYKQKPELRISGIGGPHMRAIGIELLFPMEELQVMGFIDVFLALPRLISYFRKTVRAILRTKPSIVVTIDYPGFNLRLAKTLKKKGFKGKICHYICPSVWAWGKNRIPLMEKHLDLLLSVLPFEKLYFSPTFRIEFIGHPLASQIPTLLQQDPHLIAFFPGSRTHEITKNLPYFLTLISKLQKEFPHYHYAISISQEKYRPLLEKIVQNIPIVDDLKQIKPFLAVAKSGTITLELALREIPTVVTYAISWLDTLLARYIFKISLPYYALPNLIAGKPIFPELIGPALTHEELYKQVKNLIVSSKARTHLIQECRHLKTLLGPENASQRAAQLILELPNF